MPQRSRLLNAVLIGLLGACGGSSATGNQNPLPTVTSVTVTPGGFTVAAGATQQFGAAAFASGVPVSASFTWGATGGTVNASGLFTAGGAAGPAKVWATTSAIADTSDGTVTVPPPPTTVDTVFAEGFESGNFNAWDDRGRVANQVIVMAGQHSGTRALEVTFPTGSDGGWLTKFFMPGHDSIYVSYWVRFETGWQSGTKLLALYGSRTDDQWSAAGKAGVCPNGTDFFSLDVVQERTANPGPTHFYGYYVGMGQSPPGSGTCYGLDAGATYTAPTEILAPNWHHVEYWIVLNTPGQSNTLQRYCVDGVVRGTWSGISVRTSTILMLNAVTISASIALGSPQTQRMWVDDVLVTRQRPAGAC